LTLKTNYFVINHFVIKLIILLISASQLSAAVLFFESPFCEKCNEIKKVAMQDIERLAKTSKQPSENFQLVFLNLNKPENIKKLKLELHNAEDKKSLFNTLPIIVADNKIFRGKKAWLEIRKTFSDEKLIEILLEPERKSDVSNKTAINKNNFSLGWIIIVGLLDGINPCAFALLVFLCCILRLTGKQGRKLWFPAASFIFGIYICYFLLGIGFLQSIQFFLLDIKEVLYLTAAGFCVIVAAISLIDAFRKRGEMVNGTPKSWNKFLQRFIQRTMRKNTAFICMFVAGCVSALIESVCTGQVYIPVLLLMSEFEFSFQRFLMLALYNFAFIVPLGFVATLAAYGVSQKKLENWGRKQAKIIKIVFTLLFLVFAIYLWKNSNGERRFLEKKCPTEAWTPTKHAKTGIRRLRAVNSYNSYKIIEASYSSAFNRAKCALGFEPEKGELYVSRTSKCEQWATNTKLRTSDNGQRITSIFWHWEKENLTVDFWKSSVIRTPELKTKINNIDFISTTEPGEYPTGFINKHGFNPTLIAFWIAIANENGVREFKYESPEKLINEIIKFCGSCGTKTALFIKTITKQKQ